MGFTPATQRDYIKLDLGPELHAAGLDHVALMDWDHNIDYLEEWTNAILGDKDANKYVAGTALHWYTRDAVNYSVLNDVLQRFPGKFIISTEACMGFGLPWGEEFPHGNWHNFNDYAEDIIRVLNEDLSGWVDWNMVLDMKGGPSWAGTIVTAPVHVSDDGTEYYKEPLYYAIGHFAKFVVPDSVRIGAYAKHDHVQHSDILATIFERPDKAVVVTLLNRNNHTASVEVHDPSRGYLSVELSADSLESIIWY